MKADSAKRTLVIRLIGIAMLVIAAFSLTIPPIQMMNVIYRCTETVEVSVTPVGDGDIQIEYALPGEAEAQMPRAGILQS